MTEQAADSGDRVAWGADGLVPAVVQDPGDGAVLMLGYMDAEALRATVATGAVHFHSRSRGRLWRKGETSGNELRLRALALDCDRDAILVSADPVGPTCHTGSRSCFDGDVIGPARSAQGFAWLETLWDAIEQRREAAEVASSYTARLLAGGVDACGRKVAEEATEVLLAARDDAEAGRRGGDPARSATRAAFAAEAADLVYHLLVLCAERRIDPAAVIEVLRERHRA